MVDVVGIDHIYIAVCNMAASESFYDQILVTVLGFRKHTFTLCDERHVQYFNRHFGYVLRPARTASAHQSYGPGLHHLCFRVDSIEDVVCVSAQLRAGGVHASEAAPYPQYAPDYWA